VLRVLAAVISSSALVACGADDPESRAVDPAQLKGAPAPLANLHSQANELVGGGKDAFEARIDALRGYPVVVNKWASWCAPCRSEFPYFQEQAGRLAKKVAFIGVVSNDNDGNARDFLEQLPVPYPSYKDPDLEIAQLFKCPQCFPTTAIYDSKGELAHVKYGEYAEEDLVADIERYAR
jgi:cytochrome c biogenesis protein CcmG, thiol:disulfide interchange protein DsbE